MNDLQNIIEVNTKTEVYMAKELSKIAKNIGKD